MQPDSGVTLQRPCLPPPFVCITELPVKLNYSSHGFSDTRMAVGSTHARTHPHAHTPIKRTQTHTSCTITHTHTHTPLHTRTHTERGPVIGPLHLVEVIMTMLHQHQPAGAEVIWCRRHGHRSHTGVRTHTHACTHSCNSCANMHTRTNTNKVTFFQ